MRYWKLENSNRVIAVSKEVQMTPRWKEITVEKFNDSRREELKEIAEKSTNSICTCNHPKSGHSRFIDGLFIGCQFCKCKSFEWR